MHRLFANKENNRHISTAFVLILALLLTLVMSFAAMSSAVFADTADYTTESFNVDATATKSHVIHMVEEITVNFSGAEHHGITRYIPLQSKYYKISNIETSGFDNNTESESGYTDSGTPYSYLVIRIGDADEYLSGRQTFVLSYDLICYRDTSETADYLSLDLLPTGWETPIKSTTLTLALSKSVDWNKVKFYSGSYGSTGTLNSSFTKKVYTHTDKVVITGKNLAKGEGVTVSATLPQGYWVDPANHDFAGYLLIILLIAIPLLMFILWLCFGRDPKVIRTVEFYPPEGMTPAEIGYIIDGTIDKKDMSSMLMYFAHKGYLKVNEVDRDSFELTKLKDIDESEKLFAKTMFDSIFLSGNTVRLDDMPENFGDCLIAAEGELKGYYDQKENLIYSKASRASRWIGDILMFAPALLAIALSAVKAYETIYMFAIIPVVILLLAGMFLDISVYDKKDVRSRVKSAILFTIGIVLILLGTAVAAMVCIHLTASVLLGVLLFISMAVTYLFVLLMKARTKQGAKWQGEILGFRDFIRDAEYDRLVALSGDDPEYFYNIMPYAYVMGMSTKWARKFENIKVNSPSWYRGYDSGNLIFNVLWFNAMMNSCNYSFSNSFTNFVSNGGGDFGGGIGGGIGGGFGGGGFSGGGFGGGGGGAW